MSVNLVEAPELTRIQANLKHLNFLFPGERRKKDIEKDPEYTRLRDVINRGYYEFLAVAKPLNPLP